MELEAGPDLPVRPDGQPGRGRDAAGHLFPGDLQQRRDSTKADSYNDDFEGSRDSRVTFTPTESGTYYARVSGDRDEVGSYTLSVQ